jgi:hypothetical protein
VPRGPKGEKRPADVLPLLGESRTVRAPHFIVSLGGQRMASTATE